MLKSRDYSDIKDMAHGVAAEVDRLNEIVMEMLDFGRPRPSKRVACDMREVIDHSLNLLQKETKRKRITMRNEVKTCTVKVDPDQMMQVFVNLTLNAISAVEPEKGVISFTSMNNEAGESMIAVTDNGHGIPEEKIDQVFDPFFSLSKEGTGLGLSVVYTLLSQNNVRVDVSSRLGEGTVFMLTFEKSESHPEEIEHGGNRNH
jgi:signal transduction histidine kinase